MLLFISISLAGLYCSNSSARGWFSFALLILAVFDQRLAMIVKVGCFFLLSVGEGVRIDCNLCYTTATQVYNRFARFLQVAVGNRLEGHYGLTLASGSPFSVVGSAPVPVVRSLRED